jgi:hypothetical protein
MTDANIKFKNYNAFNATQSLLIKSTFPKTLEEKMQLIKFLDNAPRINKLKKKEIKGAKDTQIRVYS